MHVRRSTVPGRRRLRFERLEDRIVLSYSSPITAEAALLAETRPYVENQIIVALSGQEVAGQSLGDAPFSSALATDGLSQSSVLLSYNDADAGPLTLVVMTLSEPSHFTTQLAQLDSLAEVAWAAPNFVYEHKKSGDLVPNDPLYASQYHHALMGNSLAWDTTLGAGIVIAVTDDGMQLDHPDLAANLYTNPLEIPGNGIDDDGNGYIDDVHGWDFVSNDNDPSPAVPADTHGTHVAGIAAGRTNNGVGISGTAGAAQIMPLRWSGSDGNLTSANTAAALRYAADNGAKIVNTSVSVDFFVGDPVYTAAMQYLYDKGLLHFNSAGNNRQLNPARQAFHQTLIVASTGPGNIVSDFTNYGTGIDIAAPGTNVLSTVTGGGYAYFDGTSMSTPNVAGSAALIWATHPTWTRDQVAAQLLGTADDLDSLNPEYAGLLGAGLANPYNALTQTLAPPRIREVVEVPEAGGTFFGTFTNLTLRLRSVFDAATIGNSANWVLSGAGADDTFGTSDDTLIPLTLTTNYMIGTNELEFVVGGPVPNDRYEFRAVASGLADPFGTLLDGNGDGTAGDDYVHTFYVVNPAEIHGTKWEDQNGNGVRDPGEPGLAGWTIYFDENGNGLADLLDGRIDEVEDNNTLATAQNVDGGQWNLDFDPNIVNSTAWPHVSVMGTGDGTLDYYSFTVDVAGSSAHFDIDDANFDSELFLYTSSGTFLDGNDDAGLDPGSSSALHSAFSYTFANPGTYIIGVGRFDSTGSPGGITGPAPNAGHFYTLHISVENHAAGVSEPHTVTDANGDYSFTGLEAGTYTLREVPQAGWVQTHPATPGSQVVLLGPSEVRTGIDFGNRPAYIGVADFPFFEDWESGGFGPWWEVVPGAEGRIEVTAAHGPYGGTYHVTLDDTTPGSAYSLNQLILHIDLFGQSGVQLQFANKGFGDDDHPQDSVEVSVDGGSSWHSVVSLTGSESTPEYTVRTYDLDGLGLAYSSDTLIRFQQYGDDPIGSGPGGMAFDNIRVQTAAATHDFGDAPNSAQSGFDASYPTTLAANGARHVATGPTLGASRDAESDGQPTVGADGDDKAGEPDEDGIVFVAATLFALTAVANPTATVHVELQNPDPASNRLDAWIDFNHDGDWDDPGEQIFANYDLGTSAGVQVLTFVIPGDTGANVKLGDTYARFRLSTAGGLAPTGEALDGEVEDHLVTIIGEGLIKGQKWNDLNGDGVKDPGEPELEGWKIYLDENQNRQHDITIHSVDADTYAGGTVLNNIQPGVTLSAVGSGAEVLAGIPESGYSSTGTLAFVTAGSSSWLEGLRVDFAAPVNFVQIDAIGNDYSDFGQLQAFDAAGNLLETYSTAEIGTGQIETMGISRLLADIAYVIALGVAENTINLDNLHYGTGEPFATTDADGNYSFGGLAPDTYHVREVAQPGWTQTFPVSSGEVNDALPAAHVVTLGVGQAVVGIDFGSRALSGSIHGQMWIDLDGDGVKDAGEPALQGWTVYLDLNGDGQMDTNGGLEPSTTTGPDGKYQFLNLAPGTYTVGAIPQAGWERTYPFLGDYQAAAVPLEFEDISATGQVGIAPSVDDGFFKLTAASLAGFEFEFYGTTYDTLFVNSNGLITFGIGTAAYSNGDLTASPGEAAIAVFWDDLVIDTSESPDAALYWEVRGSGDDQRLILQWHEVRFINGSGEGAITFQAVLRESNGSIQINYLDLATSGSHAEGASATVGIKGAGPQGDNRLLVSFNSGPNGLVGSGQSVLIDRATDATTHSVVVGPGQVVVNIDFGSQPTPPSLPGDYNGDGSVDAADYILWRKTLGSTVPHYSGADGSGNGVVGSEDYGVWTENLGATAPPELAEGSFPTVDMTTAEVRPSAPEAPPPDDPTIDAEQVERTEVEQKAASAGVAELSAKSNGDAANADAVRSRSLPTDWELTSVTRGPAHGELRAQRRSGGASRTDQQGDAALLAWLASRGVAAADVREEGGSNSRDPNGSPVQSSTLLGYRRWDAAWRESPREVLDSIFEELAADWVP